jgi:hypothetical protein
MKTDQLQQKLTRYLSGQSMPAETRQIQNWLSVVDKSELQQSEWEKEKIREEILAEIKAYTAYPLFFPRPKPWWKKVTAIF